MAWIDDHRDEVLRIFRDRFTDDEWQLFAAGGCGWQTEYGTGRMLVCQGWRRTGHIYCDEHVAGYNQLYPGRSGAVIVPQVVSSLGPDELILVCRSDAQ